MSGIINLIKNLVSGIFGFIGGLFGKKTPAIEGVANPPSKKSNSGYFLELDDSQSAKPSAASAAPASLTPPAGAIGDSENGKAPAQPKKSTRKEKLAAAAKTSNAASASIPAVKAPAPTAAAPASEVGFATKYPLPLSSGGRRLPGANMNSYLDMARQMK